MHKKLKILHIIDGFGAGGAETWLLSCAKYLNQHPELNLHFDFLASGGKEGIYDKEIKQFGSKIHYLQYSIHNIFRFRKKFKTILDEEKYDAIHNHNDFISGWHFLLALGSLPQLRIAHLHNPYNFVDNYVTNPVRWLSFKLGRLLTAFFTTKITGTSNAVMDEYGYSKWPYKAKRVDPAYCGFETEKFTFSEKYRQEVRNEFGWINKDFKIALFVGRIGLNNYDSAKNQKNPEFAFAIAKKLITQYPEWHFLFVGFKGNLGIRMETEISSLALSDKIKFLGVRSDVHKIMSASDVIIFPSLWEGLGMIAVESQCNGLPVILSEAVPKEAIINPPLVSVQNIEAGTDRWIDYILSFNSISLKERPSCILKALNSPFSIQNSINHLIKLYS